MVETKTRRFCALCGCLPGGDSEVCPNDGTPFKVVEEDSLIGTVLSERYRIDSLLGIGGMGAVYKATHLTLDRTVAVKVLRMHVGDNEHERIQRFNQEGRVISALHHPNIIGASDFGVDNGKLFLVMEYVPGKSLMNVLVAEGRLTSLRAVDIFVQISDALAYAHSQGIIHRDIKPSNVMLSLDEQGQETVKLLDFGVAKILHPPDHQNQAPLTKTGIVFGSPPYMSPEQCTGHAPDARSDVYSLGCVMYEVLSGRIPINGENSLEILHKQIIAVPLEFHELSPAIHLAKGLEAIVFKALDKDVDTRYQSMDELKNDLMQFQHNHHFVPRRNRAISLFPIREGTSPSPTRQEKRAAVIATIALILLAVSVFAFAYPRTPVPTYSTVHNSPPALIQSSVSLSKTVPAPGKKADCPATADEKALSKAVLSLTHMLERNGQGKQAKEKLKELLRSDQKSLPANAPALQDIRSIESEIRGTVSQSEPQSKH